MAKLLRVLPGELSNILRFMSSGKGKTSGPQGCKNNPGGKTPDPCSRRPDPCAKTPDPCAKTPDPCAKRPDPCAKKLNPFEKKPDPCAKKPDPCAEKPNPCAKKTDPCSTPCKKLLDSGPPSPKDHSEPMLEKDNAAFSSKNPGFDLSSSCRKPCITPPVAPKEILCCEPGIAFCPVSEKLKDREKFWQYATLLGALPAVFLAMILIIPAVHESKKKPRPEYINYSYMHRITKPYWWGDGHHSLFHNPRLNPIPPHGYEVPDPYAVADNKEKKRNRKH